MVNWEGSHYLIIPSGCYKFGDGSKDYISISYNSNYSMASDSLCISCWVYVTQTSYPVSATDINIFGFDDDDQYGLSINLGASTPYFVFHTDSTNSLGNGTATCAVRTNEWIHLAGTYNESNSEGRFYINGELVVTQSSLDGPVLTSTPSLQVSSDGTKGRPLSGMVHDAIIHRGDYMSNHAVKRLSNNILVNPQDILSHFQFSDRKGDKITDYGSLENHGAVNGGTWYDRRIRCWCTSWDETDWDVVDNVILNSKDRHLLFRNVVPGATTMLMNILGTQYYIDTTWETKNSLRIEPLAGHGLSGIRELRKIVVRTISDDLINWETFNVKIEGYKM